MKKFNILAILCSTLGGLAIPQNLLAQTVSVQNSFGEYGFGWMFGRQGTCYIVMPKHVAGPFPRAIVFTSAPVQQSTATVIAPFWPDIDLALGIARGDITQRCTARLDDLAERKDDLEQHAANLLKLSATGETFRSRIRVQDRTYLEFTGVLEGDSAEIGQGTSGAFAFVNGRPIGMAITTDDPGRAKFIRSGEILIHIRRFLDEQGGAYSPNISQHNDVALQPTASSDALPLRYIRGTVPPVNPIYAPENLVSDGQFIFESVPLMSLIFGFEDTTQVSRVTAFSTPKANQTIPKTVLLRASVDAAGTRFSPWLRVEMGPDGVLDTGTLQPRNLRHLELRILDTWGSGNVVIDRVTAR